MTLVRTFPRFLAAVAVVAAGVALPGRPSVAVTRPATLFHQAPVTSAPVEPGFPVDYASVTFELAPGADVHHDHADGDHAGTESLAVRFRHDGVWGRWQPIPEDGAQAAGQWAGALVDGDDADAYQLRGLPAFARDARGGALNTTDGPKMVVGSHPAGAAQAVSSCKSRADWGADESIRTSSRSYAPIQLMTVHHTATENDDPDPDARVRAIYEYHVRNNRWDDIGYQALISEAGTVYEGRWSGSDSPSCVTGGGSGWEFGHHTADAGSQIVTGAHTVATTPATSALPCSARSPNWRRRRPPAARSSSTSPSSPRATPSTPRRSSITTTGRTRRTPTRSPATATSPPRNVRAESSTPTCPPSART